MAFLYLLDMNNPWSPWLLLTILTVMFRGVQQWQNGSIPSSPWFNSCWHPNLSYSRLRLRWSASQCDSRFSVVVDVDVLIKGPRGPFLLSTVLCSVCTNSSYLYYVRTEREERVVEVRPTHKRMCVFWIAWIILGFVVWVVKARTVSFFGVAPRPPLRA